MLTTSYLSPSYNKDYGATCYARHREERCSHAPNITAISNVGV
ncbi:MAG: hypothetical protein OJF50_006284 [Nitrospira sp.]|nr:hypothetical protein [Nitrospira sp.]